MVAILMTSLIFTRFFLPRSQKISEEAHFNQVLSYTSAAADVVDISDYMWLEKVAEIYELVKSIQGKQI
jgi:hypothetical protein